jgi:hypothetical protein
MSWNAVPKGERNLRTLERFLQQYSGKVRICEIETSMVSTEFAKCYGAEARKLENETRDNAQLIGKLN